MLPSPVLAQAGLLPKLDRTAELVGMQLLLPSVVSHCAIPDYFELEPMPYVDTEFLVGVYGQYGFVREDWGPCRCAILYRDVFFLNTYA